MRSACALIRFRTNAKLHTTLWVQNDKHFAPPIPIRIVIFNFLKIYGDIICQLKKPRENLKNCKKTLFAPPSYFLLVYFVRIVFLFLFSSRHTLFSLNTHLFHMEREFILILFEKIQVIYRKQIM